MANAIQVPGYEAALATERRDRALAFLPLPDNICGIECVKLTPLICEWLRVYDNPFLVGGNPQPAHVLQFLWFINPDFKIGSPAPDTFISRILALNESKLIAEINEYLDRHFLDAPHGKVVKPYYSLAASMCYAMAMSPYHWDTEKTLNTPISQIYQLIKARDRSLGETVINRRSDAVQSAWMDEAVVISDPCQENLIKRIQEMAKDGWSPITEISFNNRKKEYDIAIQKGVIRNGS